MRVSQVLPLLAAFGVAVAVAAEGSRDGLLEGTLSVATADGHDCLPLATTDLAVELLPAAPAPGQALLGFADGHVLQLAYAESALQVPDQPTVPLTDTLRAEGARFVLVAPGTETCRWTGTLRLAPAPGQGREQREARLVAREATNAAFAEGDGLLAQGKAAEALAVYERAVRQRKSVLGEEHPLVLRAELRIARSLQLSGKADAARDHVEHVLAIQRRTLGDDAIDTLRSRAALGLMLWSSGRPREALPVLEQAVDRLRTRLGAGHSETLTVQGNLGLVLWDLGRLAEAAAEFEYQLPKVVAIRGERHQRSLDAMNNLGLVYQGLGRHAAALELLERAYRLSVSALGPEHPDTLTTLQSVAVGYALLERAEDALALYRVVHAGLRKSLGDDHPWTLTALSNIAASLLDLQRVDEVLDIAPDVVERAERVMGPTHVYTLRWRNFVGSARYLSGDYTQAARHFERLNALQQEAVGAEHPDTLESLANFAQARFLAGEREQGRQTLERALEALHRVNGPNHRVTLGAVQARAEMAAAEGDDATAIRHLSAFVATVERLRSDEGLARETRQAFFARWAAGYKQLALLQAARDVGAAFHVAELSKARTLLESLALRSADMAGIVGREDAARLAALDARISEFEHAISQAGTRSDEAFRIESARNALAREAAAFRRELRARHPRYAELAEVDLVDARNAPALARPGEALVSYLVADEGVVAFVVRRGRPVRAIRLGRIGGLDRSVEAYRRLLAGSLAADPLPVWRRRDGSFVASAVRPGDALEQVRSADVIGRALSDRLLRPLLPVLSGARRWIISPDAALATMPFEALPVEGKPLVATRDIRYVQSLSVLALMQARPGLVSGPGALLAMGAPRFADGAPGDTPPAARAEGERLATQLARGPVDESVARDYELRGLRWPPLPGAEREIGQVASLFAAPQRVVVTGDAASEATLRTLNANGRLAQFRYLLFATHAYLDTIVPSRSALVLSQVDLPAGTDGYITVAKWPAYRLQSELTVLSACETGLGRNVRGEGVMGLPYALFVAGNRATVLTLWRIDDRATASFVTELFRRIRAGSEVASALAATKRSFLAGPSRHREPAVWAPFVLYGR